jgi:transposase
MSKTNKRQYTNSEKVKIALDAIKGEMTIAQISSKYEVNATQIARWKKSAIEVSISLIIVPCKSRQFGKIIVS